jgi:enoyl-CoA hydratase
MNYQALRVETEQAITVVTVNRPDLRNAMNEVVIRELEHVIGEIESSKDVRVMILTGAGSSFIAGGDINMIRENLDHTYQFFWMHDRMTQLGLRIERLRVPVIAALNGAAFGGGLELALACDFRIVVASARLGLPEVGLGIMPGSGGSARLARVVGREQALLMELTGQPVDANEAYRIGLVGRVVADGEALAAARSLALQIASRPAAAVAFIKRAVTHALEMPLEGAIDYCQFAALLLGSTHDAREGLDAFLAKRPPQWRGE